MTYCCENIRKAHELIIKAGNMLNWSDNMSSGDGILGGLTLGMWTTVRAGNNLAEAERRVRNAYNYLQQAESKIIDCDCGSERVFYKNRESELVDKYNNLANSSVDKDGAQRLLSDYEEKYNKLFNKYSSLIENSVTKESAERVESEYNRIFNKYNDLVTKHNVLVEKNKNLVDKYNDLVDKFGDLDIKRQELEEERDEIREELHGEKLKYAKNIGDEKLKHVGEKSQLQIQNTRLQEKLEAANSQVIDLRKRLTDSEKRVLCLENKLDEKSNQLVALRLESGEKDNRLKLKDNELEQKKEEIERLKSQAKSSDKRAEKTQEDLLNEKLRSEKGNLELFATELKISSEQINNLIRYHERLFQARKNYNQANIETHEDNIAQIKEELKERKISIINIQEICRKCERIAELSSELGFEPKVQSQQQTNYSYLFTSRNRNWKNINPNFTEELVKEWKNHGFTYEECADWVNVNPPEKQNQAVKEPAYYAWLRDVKKVDSYWVLNEGDNQELGLEFLQWYQQNQYQARQEQPTK